MEISAEQMEDNIRGALEIVIQSIAFDKCETDQEAMAMSSKMLDEIRDRYHTKYNVATDPGEQHLNNSEATVQELWNDFYKPELRKLLDGN